MNKIKVSIIIPIYNVEAYIVSCIDSIRRQTYNNIEIIFVDDCGTDNSISVLKDYMMNHDFPPYRIIAHELNRGLSAARNTGLNAATGDYVYFLDSDDEITPECIASLAEPLATKQYDVVIGGYKEMASNAENAVCFLKEKEIVNPMKSYAEGKWYVMAWNKLCNRRFLVDNKLYFKEGLLHEDVIWSFQIAALCQSMYAIDTISYKYRVRENSIMTGMSIDKDVRTYLLAFAEIMKFVNNNGFAENRYAYQLVYGKKAGILYSLLQKKECGIYNRYYAEFHEQSYISPIKAYRKGIVSFGYLLRDLHYCLPVLCGRIYLQMFYSLCYRMRGKRIEGAVWG